MILEIQHETRLEYAAAVTEEFTEVRMEPGSDADQSCRTFHLGVAPAAEVSRYRDGFQNRVHHFNLLAPHTHVTILAASIVETHPRRVDPASTPAVFPLVEDALPLETLAYIGLHGPVRSTPLLDAMLDAVRPLPGLNLGEWVSYVARYIKDHFIYAQDVTHASSPIDDVLREGKGVCQDLRI